MPGFICDYGTITDMSSRKEERKDETTITSSTHSTSPTEEHTQYRQTVNRALDETRDNIRRSTDEARREIPRYTQAVNEYQEQTIQASREIADNYIDSQKQIINSLQSAWVPFAENTIAVKRLINNTVFANMEAFRTLIQRERDNAKEFSRINVNTAKTWAQSARNTVGNFSS